MFIIANLLNAFAIVIHWVLNIYMWVLFIRILLSWVNPDPYNPIVIFLKQVTDPVLNRVREKMPHTGMVDLSPIVVFLAIMFLDAFVVQTLQEIAFKLKAGGIQIEDNPF